MIDPSASANLSGKHRVGSASGRSSLDEDLSLMTKARELESAFLAEMLGHAGFAAPAKAFGGGIGEEQFASLLRTAQADAIVARGGIGLAERLFHALKARLDD